MNIKAMYSNWGLLPADVRTLLLKREWLNEANLKGRLTGARSFPIRVSLKPPRGGAVIDNLDQFQAYVRAWRDFTPSRLVEWEHRSFRHLGEQRLPKALIITSIQELIDYVGDEARTRSRAWQANMTPLLAFEQRLYPVLIKHLGTVEKLPGEAPHLLVELLKQLLPGMGNNSYLRALPLVGVDTKFLETYQALVADLLDMLYEGGVSIGGGLLEWLKCQENPRGWLAVRPLCLKVQQQMGGFPLLQLPGELLRKQPLPASNILVVENIQSGLGLPMLDDTVAVFGGGKNVSWMAADWLKGKRVGYWGDIDSWGLAILSDVRGKFSDVQPLMMDPHTLEVHRQRMVEEPEPCDVLPGNLTDEEGSIFRQLITSPRQQSRLEQERLSPDYVEARLKTWLDER